MHIDVELERLAQLQHTLQKPLSEVLATVIDLALSQPPKPPSHLQLPEAMSVGTWTSGAGRSMAMISAERIFLDTNVLIYASVREAPGHAATLCIARLAIKDLIPYLTEPH